jgi:hypothetical protein
MKIEVITPDELIVIIREFAKMHDFREVSDREIEELDPMQKLQAACHVIFGTTDAANLIFKLLPACGFVIGAINTNPILTP